MWNSMTKMWCIPSFKKQKKLNVLKYKSPYVGSVLIWNKEYFVCLSIVIYTPICLRKKYGLFLYSNVTSKNLFFFLQSWKNVLIKPHWDVTDTSHMKDAERTEFHGTSWLSRKQEGLTSPFAVGTLYVTIWSSRVPALAVYTPSLTAYWTREMDKTL